jgi:hypothetical protein
MDEENAFRRRRGVYLLPNLFTTAGLFAGFYAIVAALGGHYEMAAVATFAAMVMDNLDGRIARLTHAECIPACSTTPRGYGIVRHRPALIMYIWSLASLGKLGWLAAFSDIPRERLCAWRGSIPKSASPTGATSGACKPGSGGACGECSMAQRRLWIPRRADAGSGLILTRHGPADGQQRPLSQLQEPGLQGPGAVRHGIPRVLIFVPLP